jgi:hypothetical protein
MKAAWLEDVLKYVALSTRTRDDDSQLAHIFQGGESIEKPRCCHVRIISLFLLGVVYPMTFQ